MTEPEILGVLWYVLRKQEEGVRAEALDRLLHLERSIECPFLLNSRCSVYAVRPLACRILHVFGAPCKPEEIPVQDRPGDIWTPSREVGLKAVTALLPYFGFTDAGDRLRAFNEGFVLSHSLQMREIQWEALIRSLTGAGQGQS